LDVVASDQSRVSRDPRAAEQMSRVPVAVLRLATHRALRIAPLPAGFRAGALTRDPDLHGLRLV